MENNVHDNVLLVPDPGYVDFFVHHSVKSSPYQANGMVMATSIIANGVSKGEKIKNLLIKNFS